MEKIKLIRAETVTLKNIDEHYPRQATDMRLFKYDNDKNPYDNILWIIHNHYKGFESINKFDYDINISPWKEIYYKREYTTGFVDVVCFTISRKEIDPEDIISGKIDLSDLFLDDHDVNDINTFHSIQVNEFMSAIISKSDYK